MIFEDTFVVPVPVERVWTLVRDPNEMARCIPGTQRIDVIDDRHYEVVAGAKVSFLSASFAMKVIVTELVEPTRIVSVAEGVDDRLKERVKMHAALDLKPVSPVETRIGYRIDMTVSGKLASIGLTVIKGKARQMAAEFARNIQTRLETSADSDAPARARPEKETSE